MTHPLDAFLNPRAVAVVGASTVPHKAGGRRWRSLVEAGFPGPLYPIHPTATEILGRRVYRSLRELPGPVDLAVILVRPELVAKTIAECAALRIPAVVVITAGFGETGDEGRRVEQELVRTLRAAGGRLIGPNCAGLYSASGRVNVLGWSVPPGPIALVSQSGNMALTFAQFAREKGLGFSRLITVGNMADLRLAEYVHYLLDDAETRVVLLYLEGLREGEGRELYELLRHRGVPKPIVVLKPGQTEGGRRAALSHTGALAGEDRIIDAALRQARVIRVQESEEAWDAAVALASLPPLPVTAAVVVSDGGGHATVVCDTAGRLGLRLPPLSDTTRQALAKLLPSRSTIVNPVDFAGVAEEEPEVVPEVLDVCLADPQLGGAIVAGHFGGYFKIATEALGRRETAAAAALAEVVRRRGKPVVVHTIYGGESLPALDLLRRAGIPVMRSLEGAAKAMAALARWSAGRIPGSDGAGRRSHPDHDQVARVLGRARPAGRRRMLLEPEARELLELYGIHVPAWKVADTPDGTAQAAEALGPRVVLKLLAPGLVHKSDVGGVLLDVEGAAAARAGHELLMRRARQAGLAEVRVLVTGMVREGVEAIVGAVRDPQFGPVVMVGLGGVLVEVLDDVAFRVAPVTGSEAQAMLGELRGVRLLHGVRGRPPADLPAATDLIVRVSELATDLPALVELDLNPVFLLPEGTAVADARIILDPA
jgi:acetyltransferase